MESAPCGRARERARIGIAWTGCHDAWRELGEVCGEAAGSGGGFERAPGAEGPHPGSVLSDVSSSRQSVTREGEGPRGDVRRGVRAVLVWGGRARAGGGSRSERQGRPGGEGGGGAPRVGRGRGAQGWAGRARVSSPGQAWTDRLRQGGLRARMNNKSRSCGRPHTRPIHPGRPGGEASEDHASASSHEC